MFKAHFLFLAFLGFKILNISGISLDFTMLATLRRKQKDKKDMNDTKNRKDRKNRRGKMGRKSKKGKKIRKGRKHKKGNKNRRAGRQTEQTNFLGNSKMMKLTNLFFTQ